MSISDQAVQAIVDKVASSAATAQPNDLVYLAKAIEAVGASSQVAFQAALGESQKSAVIAASMSAIENVNGAGTSKINAVSAAGDAQITAINAAGDAKIAAIAQAYSMQVASVNALGNVSGAVNVNLNLGSVITLQPVGNTTVTFTNFPASGPTAYWEVEINAPTSYSVAFNGVTWDGNVAPTLAGGSKTTVLYFRTRNGGAKVYGGVTFNDIT